MMPDHALAYVIEGNPEGGTVVFIHGWPDNHTLWRHQAAALRDQFRCVLVTLPNFGPTADRRTGYNFPALVDMLHRTIERVQPDHGPISLITHDWGAYLGYMYEKAHPERVDKMVALDIGGHLWPATARAIFLMLGYQWTLIGCWLVGGIAPPIGDWLSRRFASLMGVPQPQADRVRSRFNYPYFYLWSDVLLPWSHKKLLGHYQPRCAVLFIYGGDKPLMFHSEQWTELLAKTGGRSERIEGGGHWFMETHTKEVNALILEWLAD